MKRVLILEGEPRRGGVIDRGRSSRGHASQGCFDAGSSDYITKPFRLDELLARVRVQLRDERGGEPTVLEAGRITLDVRTRKAMVGGEVVDLTAREFTML